MGDSSRRCHFGASMINRWSPVLDWPYIIPRNAYFPFSIRKYINITWLWWRSPFSYLSTSSSWTHATSILFLTFLSFQFDIKCYFFFFHEPRSTIETKYQVHLSSDHIPPWIICKWEGVRKESEGRGVRENERELGGEHGRNTACYRPCVRGKDLGDASSN